MGGAIIKIFNNYIRVFVAVFLIALVSMLIVACSEENLEPSSRAFLKYYGKQGYDELAAMEEVSTGGYILFGSSKRDTNQAVTRQMYILKVDKRGIKVAENSFGGTSITEGKAVKETKDGDFLLLGNIHNSDGTTDIFLVKVDNKLEIIWNKVIEVENSKEHGYSLTILPNGNYFILGTTSQPDGTDDMIVVNVSSEGELASTPTILGLQSKNDPVGKSVIIRQNGRPAWCGSIYRDLTENDPGTSNIRMIFSTHEGVPDEGDFNYGRKRNDFGADICKTPLGYIIVGTSEGIGGEGTKICLVKVTENGDLQWLKVLSNLPYTPLSSNQRAVSLAVAQDGGYIILAGTDASQFDKQEGQNIQLIKTDANGEVELTEIFGGIGNDIPTTVRQASDGGFLIGATVELNGDPTMCLIKTNNRGKIISE